MVKNEKIASKIICIVLRLSLGLILAEIFLRLMGIGYCLVYRIPVDTPSDYKIFCVGESTTVGVGATDPTLKGYPHQLEEMLNEEFPQKGIRCFFDQTIGQNTSEVLEKLPAYIKKYKPRLMIIMAGINNWWNLDKSNILLFNKNKFISKFTLKALIFLDQFKVWKLFKYTAYSLGLKKECRDCLAPSKMDLEETSIAIKNKHNFSIFAEIAENDIIEMIKICEDNHIRLIICSYPLSDEDLYYVHKSIARRFKLPFADNFEIFNKLPDKEKFFNNKIQAAHPNDKGYRLLAENIFNCILENKLIE